MTGLLISAVQQIYAFVHVAVGVVPTFGFIEKSLMGLASHFDNSCSVGILNHSLCSNWNEQYHSNNADIKI